MLSTMSTVPQLKMAGAVTGALVVGTMFMPMVLKNLTDFASRGNLGKKTDTNAETNETKESNSTEPEMTYENIRRASGEGHVAARKTHQLIARIAEEDREKFVLLEDLIVEDQLELGSVEDGSDEANDLEGQIEHNMALLKQGKYIYGDGFLFILRTRILFWLFFLSCSSPVPPFILILLFFCLVHLPYSPFLYSDSSFVLSCSNSKQR